LALLELSNGPTLAFKDVAMQLLGALFEHVLTGAQRAGSTSSARPPAIPALPPSTHCAAASACKFSCCRRPSRMSAFQRAQMYSLTDANIHNLAVDGVFDDCQDLVKAVAGDAEFKAAITPSAP
jgi:threonine synthase